MALLGQIYFVKTGIKNKQVIQGISLRQTLNQNIGINTIT